MKDILIVSCLTILLSILGNQYLNYMVESARGMFSGMFIGLMFPFVNPYAIGIFVSGFYAALFKKKFVEFVLIGTSVLVVVFLLTQLPVEIVFNEPTVDMFQLTVVSFVPALAIGCVLGFIARCIRTLNEELRRRDSIKP